VLTSRRKNDLATRKRRVSVKKKRELPGSAASLSKVAVDVFETKRGIYCVLGELRAGPCILTNCANRWLLRLDKINKMRHWWPRYSVGGSIWPRLTNYERCLGEHTSMEIALRFLFTDPVRLFKKLERAESSYEKSDTLRNFRAAGTRRTPVSGHYCEGCGSKYVVRSSIPANLRR